MFVLYYLSDRAMAEQMAAQKEILERRSNPKKMRKYEEQYEDRRKAYGAERAKYNANVIPEELDESQPEIPIEKIIEVFTPKKK